MSSPLASKHAQHSRIRLLSKWLLTTNCTSACAPAANDRFPPLVLIDVYDPRRTLVHLAANGGMWPVITDATTPPLMFQKYFNEPMAWFSLYGTL